jgi:integrase
MWREIYNLAEPGDFLFSKFFKPGKVAINPKQYTRRWNEYVKTAYGIKADLYSLKHLHVSEITALTNNQIAARLAGHTNTTMVDNIYDVGKHNREFQIIRQAENTFA